MTGADDTALRALQRAQLPAGVPILPTVEVAARYVGGADRGTAGGDWFDVLPRWGRIVLVVGDVVGGGVAACLAMGRLRAVLADRLLTGASVAGALTGLDRRAAREPDSFGATVCLVDLDPRSGRFDYVTAGHPPPHLRGRTAADDCELAPSGAGPLGAGGPVTTRHGVLADGEALLLCTSAGLSGGASPAASGMVDLLRAARHAPDADGDGDGRIPADLVAGRLVDGVAAALLRSGWPAGDVTFLAARRCPAPPVLRARFVAGPAAPALAREAVRSWLAPLHARPTEVDVLLHAVAELAANAGEHAYPAAAPGTGEVAVTAALRQDSTVRLSVADRGRWAPPRHDAGDRGLGLALTRGLVDALEVGAGDAGTTVTVRARVSRAPTLGEAPATAPPGDGPVGDVWHHWTGSGMSVGASGPLDDPAVPELHAHIVAATAPGLPPATLDLRRVTLLSSSAVRLIMRSRQSNGDLRILAPAGTVAERVLDLAAIAHTTTSGREADHG